MFYMTYLQRKHVLQVPIVFRNNTNINGMHENNNCWVVTGYCCLTSYNKKTRHLSQDGDVTLYYLFTESLMLLRLLYVHSRILTISLTNGFTYTLLTLFQLSLIFNININTFKIGAKILLSRWYAMTHTLIHINISKCQNRCKNLQYLDGIRNNIESVVWWEGEKKKHSRLGL